MCDHNIWLRLAGKDDFYIHNSNRLATILRQLPEPDSQHPCVVLFLGNRAKEAALRKIWGRQRRQRPRDCSLTLQLDPATINEGSPLLVVDGDLGHIPSPIYTNRDFCHEDDVLRVAWQVSPDSSVLTLLLVKLVFLFTDAIYIFADDYGGVEQVAQILLQWAQIKSNCQLAYRIRPSLFVVTSDESMSDKALRQMLGTETMAAQNDCFLAPRVLVDGPGGPAKFVETTMRQECIQSMEVRRGYDSLFSARHLGAFFSAALQHVSRTLSMPFNFISATREHNPLGVGYASNLAHFIGLAKQLNVPFDHITSYIASSVLMDMQPPGMHVFNIHDVFKQLYEAPCLEALGQFAPTPLIADCWKAHIEESVRVLSWSVGEGLDSAAGLHAKNALGRRRKFAPLRSMTLCLFCLRRQNEHFQSCGHGICDTCVRIFGSEVSGAEHQFVVSSCLPCGAKSQTKVKQLPPTAGFRILSVDGGGIGGIVALEMLKLVQATLPIPLQEIFDVVFGTSSGALIICGLFLRGWSVAKCSQIFTELSAELFRKQKPSPFKLIARFKELVRTVADDGYYSSSVFEHLLRTCFGAGRRMFDFNDEAVSGTKLAVTATDIRNTSTVLFTNYNGENALPSGSGYKVPRATCAAEEPFVWEVGQATASPPSYLPATKVAKFGYFQDGGLGYNNPVSLADREARRIWPNAPGLDVALSLGTGSEQCTSPKAARFRSILRDGFFPRLVRSISTFIDGEKQYRDWLCSKDSATREKCIRLNSQLPADESVRLDDVSKMDYLKARVHEQAAAPSMARTYSETALKLIAPFFYFQLDAEPRFEAGRYYCQGAIRCRSSPQAVIESLHKLDPKVRFLNGTFLLGRPWESDVCRLCQTYRMPIAIAVRSLAEPVNLSLQAEIGAYQIGGYGQTVEEHISRRGLRAVFGQADHGVPGRIRCICARARITSKRRREDDDGGAAKRLRGGSEPVYITRDE